MKTLIEEIYALSKELPEVKIMEVCGGHTHTIVKYGLKELLPKNITLISGPGCPVCVTSQRDIDNVVELALNGVKIGTYGDLLRVPGTKMSLEDVRSKGGDIKAVYTVEELIKEKDRVFFSIGFETTTPMTAYLLKKGITVYSTNRLLMPALYTIKKDSFIDGFILPGHVSTIIGVNGYEGLNMPGVISGFKPEDVLSSILMLLKMIKGKEKKVINNYERIVSLEGNVKAQKLIKETMKVVDMRWRGFGTIPESGLDPIKDELNARIKFKDILKKVKSHENKACRCPDIVRGKATPKDCPLFGKFCSPESPKGACMVSDGEGICNISYTFLKSQG